MSRRLGNIRAPWWSRSTSATAARWRACSREHKPDFVMHLAAESHVDRSIDGPGAFVDTNIVGTYVMLEAARAHWLALPPAAREAFRFHHISTDEVYGSLGPEGAFTEDTAYAPNSPYAASKAASDHLVRAWHHTFGLPVVMSNCSNNYGPYQFPEKLIPLVILNAVEGKPLPVYGQGTNIRDWLHVDDHAAALALILTRGRVGERYNVGGNAERTNIAVVREICRILDELLPQFRAPAARQAHHLRDRPSRARPALRHRRLEDKARAGLGAEGDVRVRAAQDGRVVSRQRRVGACDPWPLRRRAHRPVDRRAALMTAPLIIVFGRTGQVGSELARAASAGGSAPRLDWHARRRISPPRQPRSPPRSTATPAMRRPSLSSMPPPTPRSIAPRASRTLRTPSTVTAPAAIAQACAARGFPLIHLSTDYVFDGRKPGPYREDDPVGPDSVYGRTKLAGEEAVRAASPAHVIVRTAWVYSPFGTNFVKTMLRLSRERPELGIVNDQHGCPTAAHDIAAAIVAIASQLASGKADGYGTFHYCGAGACTWFELGAGHFRRRRPPWSSRPEAAPHRDGRVSDAGQTSGQLRARLLENPRRL